MAAISNPVTLPVTNNFFNQSLSAISTVANSCGTVIYNFFEVLGARNGGSIPNVVKLVDGVARIIKGCALNNPAAQTVLTIADAVIPAASRVTGLTTIFTDFTSVVDAVLTALRSNTKGVKVDRRFVVDNFSLSQSQLPPAPTVPNTTVGPFAILPSIITVTPKVPADAQTIKFTAKVADHSPSVCRTQMVGAIVLTFAYLSTISETILTLTQIEALKISDVALRVIKQVAGYSLGTLAVVGTLAATAKFIHAAYNVYQIRNDVTKTVVQKETANQALILATLTLTKAALKISAFILAMHFTVLLQGVSMLTILAIDTYLAKYKDTAIDLVTFTVV